MKVFISWSGERSQKIAEILKVWIPSVIQAVEPFYSTEDIAKGTRSIGEISNELASSNVGIICLTQENLNSSWIMFEAGALSKNFGMSKVCPLLLDIKPSNVTGPLTQFQSAGFTCEDMKRVMKMINGELKERALADDVFNRVYDKWWPELEKEIQAIPPPAPSKEPGNKRSIEDMVEEVLELTRKMSMDRMGEKKPLTWAVWPNEDKDKQITAQEIKELMIYLNMLKKPDLAVKTDIASSMPSWISPNKIVFPQAPANPEALVPQPDEKTEE